MGWGGLPGVAIGGEELQMRAYLGFGGSVGGEQVLAVSSEGEGGKAGGR